MLGFCYWKTNKKELVAPLYRQIPQWCRENQSYDTFALRKSKRFLELEKFSEFDELYISAYALLEGKQYQAALTTIEKAIPLLKDNPNNREWYAQYYFLKGCCLRGLKKDDRALQMFQVSSNHNHLSVICKSFRSSITHIHSLYFEIACNSSR
jgi:tetratricopeptide (TPR) repeat protein